MYATTANIRNAQSIGKPNNAVHLDETATVGVAGGLHVVVEEKYIGFLPRASSLGALVTESLVLRDNLLFVCVFFVLGGRRGGGRSNNSRVASDLAQGGSRQGQRRTTMHKH